MILKIVELLVIVIQNPKRVIFHVKTVYEKIQDEEEVNKILPE